MIYAGGGIGEGPSVLENIFSAGLGMAGLFILWFLLELGGHVSMSIAEERDLASGMRLCGLLLAAGLILGRAVAGDWHSAAATVGDFIRDGWPAALLCAIGIAVERFARPSHRCPIPPWGSRGCCRRRSISHLARAGCGASARGKECPDDRRAANAPASGGAWRSAGGEAGRCRGIRGSAPPRRA